MHYIQRNEEINLLNIGVRLMHVVTSSQIIFYPHLYFNTFNKGGSVLEYMSRTQGYGCSVHMQKVYERCTTLIFPRQSAKIV